MSKSAQVSEQTQMDTIARLMNDAKIAVHAFVEDHKTPLVLNTARNAILFLDTAYLWVTLLPGSAAATGPEATEKAVEKQDGKPLPFVPPAETQGAKRE